MAVVLTVLNNSAAVSNGLLAPRFTMNVKGLDTRNKTLNLESAQFELHFENIDKTSNKLYGKAGDVEERLDIVTGTYTNIEDLISVINETKESRTFGHHVHLLSPYQSSRCFGSGRQDMHVPERFTECSVGSRRHRFSLPHRWVAHLSLCSRSF